MRLEKINEKEKKNKIKHNDDYDDCDDINNTQP